MISRPFRLLLSRSVALLLAFTAIGLPGRGAFAQTPAPGQFTNPVLPSDYSDPDVIRDGKRFYLVASSFAFSPGLPVLESPDLVHWTVLTHILPRLTFGPKYDMQGGDRYGRGVWAPALRKHNGLFYVYFPTPDEGIFVATAKSMAGPWSEPVAVIAGAGLEDPCPFWDDDGTGYLVHSRTGAGPLILHRLAPDGKSVLDEGKEIVRDRAHLPTLEGPKLYKRNGWYYIFAPFGGVSTGAQAVLRSRSIYGPYDFRTVLAQGTTAVNGPHQGGWVDTPDGHNWFLHFHSSGGHGRIVYLEPMRWEEDWPVIGEAAPGATAGQPVAGGPVPVVTRPAATARPQTSDEFNAATLGQQWEWNHNPVDGKWSLTERKGYLRLHPQAASDLTAARNTLTQQMQDLDFRLTTRLDVSRLAPGTHAGLAMFQKGQNGLEVVAGEDGSRKLHLFSATGGEDGPVLKGGDVLLRVEVHGDRVRYSCSADGGKAFQAVGQEMPIAFSWWKGTRPALFAYTQADGKDGPADFDWVHYEVLPGQAN